MLVQRVVRVVAAALTLAIVLGTGIAWSNVRSFEDGIFHMFAPSLGKGGDDGAIDILLVGLDSRTDAHGNPLSAEELATLRAGDDESTNTDTIILIRIPNNGKSATAISIPRDSYVAAPGLGKTKINGVYGQTREAKRASLVQAGDSAQDAMAQGTEAGRDALIKTVADLTGVTVDHYAEIGLLGFALITDALGGVDVCLKDAVFEPLSGADFPAGRQRLNGPQALSFVRQRHDLPRGDLDRVVRQQVVMASLAHRVISGQTLSSPTTLRRLEPAVQRSVVISAGWDVMDFVQQMQKLAGGKVAFATIPVLDGAGWSDDGMQSVVRVDPHQVQDWVAGLLQDQAQGKTEELAYTPAKTTADVVNATDINGLAAAVSDVLSSKGFTTGTVGNNEGGHVKGSQVRAAKTDDLGAQEVAKELGGLPVVADTSLAPGSVKVVLANDYTGPGSGLCRRPEQSGRARPRVEPGDGRRSQCSRAVADPDRRLRQAGVHQLSTPTTLSGAILDPMLRADPVGPRITYYDDATGERIELSAVTLANWAAKTGNLLRDEMGAGPASRIAILLPAHWQTAAVLFGVWWIGAEAVLGGPGRCGAVHGRTGSTRRTPTRRGGEVAVLSLDPFGRPAPDLPIGVTDYATAVRVHGDQIVPEARPGPALAGRSVDEILADCESSAAARELTRATGCFPPRHGPGPTSWWTVCCRSWPWARRWCRWPIPIRRCCSAESRPKRSPGFCEAGGLRRAGPTHIDIAIYQMLTSCKISMLTSCERWLTL